MRVAVIGVGANIFSLHAAALRSPDLEVVGVSDINLSAAERHAESFGCPYFVEHQELLAATHPQAAVVLAPHPFHPSITIDCLLAGAHVLVEKPIAVEIAEADRMRAVAAASGRLLAVNLQHRTRGEVRAAKKLIDSGRLGTIQRVQMVGIWTRAARYYEMAGWRGTWRGEGGGVLMNQAPHSLDLICHLVGQPTRVAAWNRTQWHAIETEDTSVAMLEWSDGAVGTLLVSTAQAGEIEYLEIAGMRGVVRLTRGELSFLEADEDLRDFLRNSHDPFAQPPVHACPVPLEPGTGDHAAIYANFLEAVEHGAPLVADAAQASLSLELANALIYSSATSQQISLPLDRQVYSSLLAGLRS